MDDSNKKQFATLFYGLAEEYGGTITKNGVKLKFEALEKYTINDIVGAANWIIRNRKTTFPAVPTVKEFIDAINFQKNPLSIEDIAEMQAVFVISKIQVASYIDVVFEDPITKAIMTDRWPFVSWARNVLESEISWWKKDFIKLYKSYDNHVDAGLLIKDGDKKLIPASNLKKLIANNQTEQGERQSVKK